MSKRSMLIVVLVVSSSLLLGLSTVAASGTAAAQDHGRQAPGGKFKPDIIPYTQVTFERSVQSHGYDPVVAMYDGTLSPPPMLEHYRYAGAGTPVKDAEAATYLANQVLLTTEWQKPESTDDFVRVAAEGASAWTGLAPGDVVTSLGAPTVAQDGGNWVVTVTGKHAATPVTLTFAFGSETQAGNWSTVITNSRGGSREGIALLEISAAPLQYIPTLSCVLGQPCSMTYNGPPVP